MQKSYFALIFLATICLVGCGDDKAKQASPADKKAFMGGPMPKDFQEKINEQAAAAAAKAKASGGAPPPGVATGK